jgi:tetratricopeptide (TPR) repeat protein
MLQKKYSIILFAIFTLLSVNNTSADNQKIESLIREGLNLSYNFQIEAAEKSFSSLIKKYPNDPRGYHYKSTIYLWNYIGNSDKKDLEKFLSYSDLAIEKSNFILNETKNVELAKFVLGSSYGYRSIAFGKAEKYLDMIWASKKSSSYLTEVIELNDKNYDAYLGLGLFKFALSKVPSAFKWALSTIGFNGNQEEGLRYLSITSEKGLFAKVEAKFYLAQIYSEYFNEFEKSGNILSQLSQTYPGNLLFLYSSAVTDLKDRQLVQSEKQLQRIIKEKKSQFPQITSYSYFLLGDISFRRNHFDKAKEFYIQFLASNLNNDYNGIAYYRLAICHEMLEERPSAKMYFQLSSEGNLSLDDDAYAKRRGNIFSARVLTGEELSLIRFSNMVEAKNYNIAVDSLKQLFENCEDQIVKSEASYWLSEAYFCLSQFSESIEYAQSAIHLKPGTENWIQPYAYFNLARASIELKNDKRFFEYLEKASSYSNYDYENKLKSLISGLKSKKDA